MGITNALTVDVEDYFQVSALESAVDREQWNNLPLRVERNCERIFKLFDESGVKATFFVLGWVAQRCPGIVENIIAQGHELASHGFDHRRVHQLTAAQFREDVVKTKKMLEDMSGVAVKGYRAPSYSINTENYHWALSTLAEAGYEYSSSIYPIHHDLYGIPEAPRFCFHPLRGKALLEIPCSTVHYAGRNLPCAGGGYFRLLPYALSRWAIRRLNRVDARPSVFYFHPWEIDPEQPRQRPISLKTRVRHYVNLSRMEYKLTRLLGDFSWDRMDRVFLGNTSVDYWEPGLAKTA